MRDASACSWRCQVSGRHPARPACSAYRSSSAIRRRGQAIDQEEFTIGVSSVGAPVFQSGRLIAALGIAVPTECFNKRRRESSETLLEVSAELDVAKAASV
jgi:DNA-binding IclR family transcriptional regulator